jgi:hypothetical protein
MMNLLYTRVSAVRDSESVSVSPVVNALRKLVDSELSNPFSDVSDQLRLRTDLDDYLSTATAVVAFEVVCMGTVVVVVSSDCNDGCGCSNG